MKQEVIVSGNVSIAVNLFGAEVVEDNQRTYLKGKPIQDLFFQLHVRDEMLTFHKDWNMLIEACKVFTDFRKMFNKYEAKLVGEYPEYCLHVKCINELLVEFKKEELFMKLVNSCDWLMNLTDKKSMAVDYYNK